MLCYKEAGKQHRCTECDFESSLTTKMMSHKKREHGIPYDFVCESCGMDFLEKGRLLQHQKVHTNTRAKDHKCGICEYCSDRRSEVRRHTKKVHNVINIEMRCQHCEFEAGELSKLETHLQKSHRDEAQTMSCDKCKFSAYHGPTMEFHVNSMHNAKCELCSFRVGSSIGLKAHISKKHLKRKTNM